MGRGFVSGTARANGTTLYYVRGGTDPAVILLHGFPEDWYEYHRVMPLLATHFAIVAVDLRGMSDSAATLALPLLNAECGRLSTLAFYASRKSVGLFAASLVLTLAEICVAEVAGLKGIRQAGGWQGWISA